MWLSSTRHTLLLRVRFTPTEKKLPNLTFRDIHNFVLPVTEHIVDKVSSDKWSHQYRTTQDQNLYCLIAVVRLRDSARGEEAAHDYVRIYELDGRNVFPHGDQQRYKGFVNDEWSVEQQDHSYMLYYIKTSRPPPVNAVEVGFRREDSPRDAEFTMVGLNECLGLGRPDPRPMDGEEMGGDEGDETRRGDESKNEDGDQGHEQIGPRMKRRRLVGMDTDSKNSRSLCSID